VGLISSGTSSEESAFLDASETGGDVFFLTTAQLAPQDVDDAYDIYDAHECTSVSPCLQAPAVRPPECTTADSCRAAPTPQPAIFGAPASATFSGAGNVTPAPPAPAVRPRATVVRCRKHFVKKRDKCIKEIRHRKGHAGKASRDRGVK
jgi:hypothetical protein